MKELKGTKTEKNLLEAFAGESQARNKYTYYASKAKKDGYEQIAAIFEETANNEKEHAKLWFKYLHNGEIASTMENLKTSMLRNIESGEHSVLIKIWESAVSNTHHFLKEEDFLYYKTRLPLYFQQVTL